MGHPSAHLARALGSRPSSGREPRWKRQPRQPKPNGRSPEGGTNLAQGVSPGPAQGTIPSPFRDDTCTNCEDSHSSKSGLSGAPGYAIRWENVEGRFGYMPKADRDWKSYLSAKDEDRKKIDRLTRKYRPLTDDVVREHLVGEHTDSLDSFRRGL